MKRFVFLFLVLCLTNGAALASDAPYGGYASTPYGSIAPSPLGYEVADYLVGNEMGAGALNKPNDLFVESAAGLVYIADTGNRRIVVLDSNLQYVTEYTSAGDTFFESPKGVFADGRGHVYVADDVLGLTLMMDEAGQLVRVFERPVSELYEESMPYMPQKLVSDSAGRVYVLSQGVFQGLVCFNPDGSFLSFYGANHVEVTAKLAMQKLLRLFMTREQWAGLESFIPIEYSNIDIDSEDMIYASVGTLEQTGGYSVFKLNPLGVAYRKHAIGALADVLDNEDGVYACLTRDTKEIVEFADTTATGIVPIMLTCGGNGTQRGLFQDPCAIERLDGDLLVLDRQSGAITRFRLTAFGRAVHDAIRYSSEGRFQEAIELYNEILKMDSHYTYAYDGLGAAYYEMEQYEEAMRYFRLAQDRQGYSDAFKEYSTALLRQNMGLVLIGALVLFIAFKIVSRRRRRTAAARRAEKRYFLPWRHPFHCMTHAYSGFEGIKLQGEGSLPAAIVIVGLFFLSSVINYVLTGFAYNPNQIERLNVPLLLAGTLGSFGLFYLSTLAVSSLMSACEGKPKELFIAESYALLPFILGSIALSVLTNFLTLDMQAFTVFFIVFCILWSVILFVVGMMQVNQLTLKMTLLYLLLVIFSLVMILVLIVLLYSLVQQFIVFLETLYSEMMYRM